MEPRGSDDLEEGDPSQLPPRSRVTARSVLSVLTIMLSLALLGLGIKMSVKYDDTELGLEANRRLAQGRCDLPLQPYASGDARRRGELAALIPR